MAHIIGFIQVKGGAGRSTLATNVAGVFSGKYRVALIDCDMPQGTSASWYALRKQDGREHQLDLATATDHRELVKQVERLNANHDLIVIDAPPRIAEVTRAALVLSSLCLIPLGASAAEIWATADLLKTIEQAKAIKPEVDARIVWNRFRSATRSAQELSEAVRDELGLPQLNTRLGYRVAYSDALARGFTVAEWSDPTARDELVSLGQEISQILKIKREKKA